MRISTSSTRRSSIALLPVRAALRAKPSISTGNSGRTLTGFHDAFEELAASPPDPRCGTEFCGVDDRGQDIVELVSDAEASSPTLLEPLRAEVVVEVFRFRLPVLEALHWSYPRLLRRSSSQRDADQHLARPPRFAQLPFRNRQHHHHSPLSRRATPQCVPIRPQVCSAERWYRPLQCGVFILSA